MNLPPDDPLAEGTPSAARSVPQKLDLESKDRLSKMTEPPESNNEDRCKTEEPKSSDCHSEITEELRMYHPTKRSHYMYNESEEYETLVYLL